MGTKVVHFFRPQTRHGPYKTTGPLALGLPSPVDKEALWPLLGGRKTASRLFCPPRDREQSRAVEIKTTGCAVPAGPVLDKSHLEGDSICLHIVLLQMPCPWTCTLPEEDSR